MPFAAVDGSLRQVFDPLNGLGRELPSADGPGVVAPCEAAEAGGRFFGPDLALTRIGRGG